MLDSANGIGMHASINMRTIYICIYIPILRIIAIAGGVLKVSFMGKEAAHLIES